jgi:hypothetical protein
VGARKTGAKINKLSLKIAFSPFFPLKRIFLPLLKGAERAEWLFFAKFSYLCPKESKHRCDTL